MSDVTRKLVTYYLHWFYISFARMSIAGNFYRRFISLKQQRLKPTFPEPLVLADSSAPMACSLYSLSRWSYCAWILLQPKIQILSSQRASSRRFQCYERHETYAMATKSSCFWCSLAFIEPPSSKAICSSFWRTVSLRRSASKSRLVTWNGKIKHLEEHEFLTIVIGVHN